MTQHKQLSYFWQCLFPTLLENLNSVVLFQALLEGFGNSWSCQKSPNHLLHKTKGSIELSNARFQHIFKPLILVNQHGELDGNKESENKCPVYQIWMLHTLHILLCQSKKWTVDMCVNIHTCDTALFFHCFYHNHHTVLCCYNFKIFAYLIYIDSIL